MEAAIAWAKSLAPSLLPALADERNVLNDAWIARCRPSSISEAPVCESQGSRTRTAVSRFVPSQAHAISRGGDGGTQIR